MKRLVSILMVCAALAVSACGSEGGTVATPDAADDVVTEDSEEPVFGCQSAQECIGKYAPADCQKVDCVNGACVVVADPGQNGQTCETDDLCAANAVCFQGQCKGEPKECSDENPCTTDSCNAETGECEFTNNTAKCDDSNPCTSGDKCQDGTCTGGESVCGCLDDADCEKYDDGNPCNGISTCVDNACEVDPASIVDCSDTPVEACETAYCDEADGACKVKNKADGTTCDAGDECLANQQCKAGECKGTPVKCDDQNKCTTDSCDPDEGCVFAPVDNGTACNDGSLCTENDQCVDGACTGDTVAECDSCEADADCQAFEDGNLCNGTLICNQGECVVDEETIVTCQAPADSCQQVKCIQATGECQTSAALDGTACDDQNACTQTDYCSGGVCKGLPVDCDDKNACTTDSCNPDVGCEYTPKDNTCGDGDPCTINDTCVEGVCVGEPNPECQCETDEDCAEDEDGDLCNGTLVCQDKKCVVDPDTVVDCEIPGLSTCMLSTCEPETGECVLTELDDGSDCNDKNACTAGDKCFDGICKGAPKTCDDGNVCTDDSCDVNLGCVYSYNAADCDDGDPCTLDDFCAQGQCVGNINPECQCQSNADCAAFEDGNPCNGTLVCKAFKCKVDPDTVVTCDKSNDGDCKVTYCNPETGSCVTSDFADGKPCNDDDVCTKVDVCSAGECVGNLPLACDDGNPCTNDSCDPQLGCIAVPNAQPCDDGDPCTGGDTCSEGVCQPGDEDLCGDTCIPEWTLKCGGTDTWGTDMFGATDVVDEYACAPDPLTGPEYTYTFTAPYDAEITVSLSGEEAETDIIVLESMGEGCDPEQCRAHGYSKATFAATAGQTYFFVVDGFEWPDGEGLPGEGGYTIKIECKPDHEMNCGDGIDEDGDDLVDCDDDDCLGTPACPLPICQPGWNLECGESDSWATHNWGATDVIEGYECNGFTYAGPEYAYVFVAPVSKTITVTLTEETAETDVLVLEAGAQGECAPDNCVAWGMKEATFDAVAGQTYFFVVDGFLTAEGSYTITVTCPPDVEGKCDDGIDNDQDGDLDCDDADCLYADACSQTCNPWYFPFEVSCGFEEDYLNYSLFSTDKAESYVCTEDLLDGPEYTYSFTAPYDASVTVTLTEESAETDVLVVEADEADDCLTVNCLAHDLNTVTFQATAGALYYVVVDGYDGAKGTYHIAFDCTPATEMDCTDGKDDDGNGLTDCLDPACFPGAACEPACEPDTVEFAQLTCGGSDGWSTDGDGSADNVDAYACNAYDYAGSEYTYTLTFEQAQTVTVTLSEEVDDAGDPVDLDLLVLADDGLGCNPASCIAYGFGDVTFEADPALTYYVVVDGYAGAQGNYLIDVTCE